MDVDAVRALLHLPAPGHDRGVGVFRRVVEVEHLEALGVASDEGRLDVLELVLTLAVGEKLTDLVQQDDLDGLVLVDDALGVVNAVGSGEVDGVAVLFVGDFHGADGDLEKTFIQAQALDGSLDFLVDRLPELVVPLADDHGRAVLHADDLINDLDGSL